ncbi:dysbindin domain-containing protein 1 isoform X2 [Spea bombifrons]|uniref:dysbindin domain-containing protein 1 isoform X2 n=1 Tax=Spea bombifrons TaxID=233779 RepID=UPI00234AE0DC|nr:dysbindin domain-containing protein 1 isoform X2 [Spea bombifrons]
MEAQQGPGTPVLEERSREAGGSSGSHPAASTEVTVEEPQQAGTADEESGVLVPVSGLLQVTERRHMSDQELVEVFADSDDENQQNEPPLGLQLPPLPRPGYLRSSSWTRSRAEREKKHLSDSELQGGLLDSFITAERSKEN